MKDLSTRQLVRRIRRFQSSRYVPILMYHQIKHAPKDKALRSLCVSPEKFEKQVKFLLQRGFRTISLDQLIGAKDRDSKNPRKTFVITFDDGCLDNYTNAFPILLKYGLAATVFVVSDYMGAMKRWGTCKGTRLMTWGQAREMSKHGISFQSHTCTHPDLTKLDHNSALPELKDSRKKIEDALGVPVWHFAYPFARYDERTIELVKEVGYRSACAGTFSPGGRFCIERFECSNAFDRKFRMETCAWYRRLRLTWHRLRITYSANC